MQIFSVHCYCLRVKNPNPMVSVSEVIFHVWLSKSISKFNKSSNSIMFAKKRRRTYLKCLVIRNQSFLYPQRSSRFIWKPTEVPRLLVLQDRAVSYYVYNNINSIVNLKIMLLPYLSITNFGKNSTMDKHQRLTSMMSNMKDCLVLLVFFFLLTSMWGWAAQTLDVGLLQRWAQPTVRHNPACIIQAGTSWAGLWKEKCL